MNPDQRAALLVLRDQISDQIDGDSPTDSLYTQWTVLADYALGNPVEPWALMQLSPEIKAMKLKL